MGARSHARLRISRGTRGSSATERGSARHGSPTLAEGLLEPLMERMINNKEADMTLVGMMAFPVFLYTAERVVALVRKSRIESRRAKADYPITGNDPVGRTVIF
jgi:hypothetical protein